LKVQCIDEKFFYNEIKKKKKKLYPQIFIMAIIAVLKPQYFQNSWGPYGDLLSFKIDKKLTL
jgi:hypothetical protein